MPKLARPVRLEDIGSLVDFFKAVLSDENGIGEEAYLKLVEVAEANSNCSISAEVQALMERTEATDGRFYLRPETWDQGGEGG